MLNADFEQILQRYLKRYAEQRIADRKRFRESR